MLSDAWFRDLKIKVCGLKIKLVERYFFLKNYVTSEVAVSHSVLYYQQLSIVTRKVFMLTIILSNIPIVSTAFKQILST